MGVQEEAEVQAPPVRVVAKLELGKVVLVVLWLQAIFRVVLASPFAETANAVYGFVPAALYHNEPLIVGIVMFMAPTVSVYPD